MNIKTDFYKFNGSLYYVTPDPLDDNFIYVMLLPIGHKELHYSNMYRKQKDGIYIRALMKYSASCNIGWVPINYDVFKEHPELLI